mgnify:CR=1 FL=1
MSDPNLLLPATILVVFTVLFVQWINRVNIWTILMFQFIKRSDALNKAWGISSEFPIVEPLEVSDTENKIKVNFITIGTILAVMLITYFIPMSFLMSVVILSIVGLILGNVIPAWNHQLVLKIAGYSIVLIMAILGLKLNFSNLSLPIGNPGTHLAGPPFCFHAAHCPVAEN